MSAAAFDRSAYLGAPVELFVFSRGNERWTYTNNSRDLLLSGQNYSSRWPIQRQSVEQSPDMSKATLTVDTVNDLPVLVPFKQYPPSNVTTLVIYRVHITDPDKELETVWTGVIGSVSFAEKQAKISCSPLILSTKRSLLRRYFQVQCPYILYGDGCFVSRAEFQEPATVESQIGLQLNFQSLATFPDDYFSGGWAEWQTLYALERRFIQGHTGNSLILDAPFVGIPGGAAVTLYPGCDHSLSGANGCGPKFNNTDNYGGFPFIPPKNKNPFGGNPIY